MKKTYCLRYDVAYASTTHIHVVGKSSQFLCTVCLEHITQLSSVGDSLPSRVCVCVSDNRQFSFVAYVCWVAAIVCKWWLVVTIGPGHTTGDAAGMPLPCHATTTITDRLLATDCHNPATLQQRLLTGALPRITTTLPWCHNYCLPGPCHGVLQSCRAHCHGQPQLFLIVYLPEDVNIEQEYIDILLTKLCNSHRHAFPIEMHHYFKTYVVCSIILKSILFFL